MRSAPVIFRVLPAAVIFGLSGLLQVFADPETGEQPEAIEPPKWAVLKEQMRRDAAGLQSRQHVGAHRSVNLEGRYLHMSAAVRDSKGRVRKQCFTGYEALDNALKGKTAVSHNEDASDETVEQ